MKRIFCTLSVIAFLILSACGAESLQSVVSGELGIDASACGIISASDTHGGLHGDGITFIVLDCADGDVLNQIKEKSEWRAFPLDDTVKTLVYGIDNETERIGPYLTDQEGNSLVPEIENGYYRLIDRQVKEGWATGADILHRGSFNFTLGLYDADAELLYFCELDT